MASPTTAMEDVETASDGYASRFAGEAGRWLLEVQTRAVVELLGSGSGGQTILDVGGGHGQIARPLSERGFQVTVAGSTPEADRQVRDLVADGKCKYVTGDLLHLPFPDKSFDVVTCFRLLPHCEVWPELVRELCRVARRSVIVDYPTWHSINALTPLLFSLKKRFEGNTRTYLLFSTAQVRKVFGDAGFKVRGKVGQFVVPMVIHRALKAPAVSERLELPFRVMGVGRLIGSPVVARFDRTT